MAEKKQVKKQKQKNKPLYEKILDLNDNKINVLILGTSGSGKSTLINSILQAEEAPVGIGQPITSEIKVYQDDSIPFRMIDTVGYEFGFLKQNKIKRDLIKFAKEGVKKADIEKLVHMIWFCIDGTVKRIDQTVLDYIKSVTNDWKDVPVIVVFTKSYSEKETSENIQMARDAFAKFNEKHKKHPLQVKDIIPVVAKEYPINDSTTVPVSGIDHLILRTNELAPEAKQIAKDAIKEIDLKIKRNMASTTVGTATLVAATIGAIPITPFTDSALLVPVQMTMMKAVAKAYSIKNDSITNEIIDNVLKAGATTLAGKGLLGALKAIPGINIAGAVLNAVVAGTITLVAGQASLVLFEKIYTGEIDKTSIDWNSEVAKLFDMHLPAFVEKIEGLSKENGPKLDIEDVKQLFIDLIQLTLKKSK